MKPGVLGLLLTLALAAPVAHAQTPAPIAETPAETPIVIGRSYALPSAIMGATREINVWLPPGYADSGKTYPVLYVLDGGQDQDFHHISGLAQLGTVAGTTRDVIV
ncbi:MAG: alpha/beta hydrolase-fold protein, partial [Hyphomonas sp.]